MIKWKIGYEFMKILFLLKQAGGGFMVVGFIAWCVCWKEEVWNYGYEKSEDNGFFGEWDEWW